MKKCLIIVNQDTTIHNFRMEMIQSLIENNFVVYIMTPKGAYEQQLRDTKANLIIYDMEMHGKNPFSDLKIYKLYKKTIKEIMPDVVLTFTIKPNIYGSIASRRLKVPVICTITGLGVAVENPGLLQIITTNLYKIAFKKVNHVFFQNQENCNFFIKKKIVKNNYSVIPGSGVNLEKFKYIQYPNDKIVRFSFIGRLIKEKGLDYYLETARFIKIKYPNTEFHIAGSMEPEYEKIIADLVNKNIIIYHGRIDNLPRLLENMHCTINPTYYPEGMSNVLLESSATGKPSIGTNRSGVKETIDNGITGFIIETKDQNQLNNAVERFLHLSFEQKEEMGRMARLKVEKDFDRKIVVSAYNKKIQELMWNVN